MKPELIETKLPNGSHGNWQLIDEESGKILWEEWGENTICKMSYDFVNDREIIIDNPNRKTTHNDHHTTD